MQTYVLAVLSCVNYFSVVAVTKHLMKAASGKKGLLWFTSKETWSLRRDSEWLIRVWAVKRQGALEDGLSWFCIVRQNMTLWIKGGKLWFKAVCGYQGEKGWSEMVHFHCCWDVYEAVSRKVCLRRVNSPRMCVWGAPWRGMGIYNWIKIRKLSGHQHLPSLLTQGCNVTIVPKHLPPFILS